ncbi:hypothetical protein [Kandleria vitulina]|nr:hypothetical protein [Kandleria vitulina]
MYIIPYILLIFIPRPKGTWVFCRELYKIYEFKIDAYSGVIIELEEDD